MHIIHIVGARPNFMKVAPVLQAFKARPGVVQTLLHTGQHYDRNMSDVFFTQLGLPEPDIHLGVGSGSHAVQTGTIMARLEEVFGEDRPDLCMVYGDVNSTAAAAMVCAKLLIPLAHVEAGLRSGDRRMPEEVNRLVTDRLSDLLFTPSRDGDANLLAEGVPAGRIHFVGNVMIDTLMRLLPRARQGAEALLDSLGLGPKGYGLVTLHRPSNVDRPEGLERIMAALGDIAGELPLVFPVHPRTRARFAELGVAAPEGLTLTDPVGYLDFLALQENAKLVITDSGGIQEETTVLGVPCLTVRENTERPVTVDTGSNILVGTDMPRLVAEVRAVLEGRGKHGDSPEFWDGKAGERIAEVVCAGGWSPWAEGA